MPQGFSLVNFTNAMKKRYASNYVDSMVYKGRPLMALIKKMEDFGGKDYTVPILYSNPQSRSYTIAGAQALADTEYSRIEAFTVTRVKDFGVIRIEGELLEASKKDEDAFFRGVTQKVDGILDSQTENAAIAMYRKGFGTIGAVSAPSASTTLTLVDPTDVVNFNVGNVLSFSSSEDSAALRAGTLTVTGVNRSAGTLTVGANVTTVTAIATGDSIFISGDREDSVTPSRRKLSGLEDWCPQIAPTSTPFFGVNRTTDSRLGGVRFDGSSAPIEEALIEASMLLGREGGNPDYVFMNPSKLGDLIKALGAKVSYTDVKTPVVGFRAVELHTPVGSVKVIGDRYCPANRAFMLQLDTWTLGSLGKMPKILNLDGNESLRLAADDGIEIRTGWYGQMFCKAPGWNCNIKL